MSVLADLQGEHKENHGLEAKIDGYVETMDEAVVAYLDEDNRVRGNILARKSREIAAEIEEILETLVATAETDSAAAGQMVIDGNTQVDRVSLFLLVAVPLLGVFLAWWFSRTITTSIKIVVEAMKDIAEGEGDLTQRIKVNGRDEIAELAGWFNIFVEKFHGAIAQTADVTEQVAYSATELSSTSEQIASGSKQTSAQADTVASATKEMSAVAQEIAKNCTYAVEAADVAIAVAESGKEVVHQTIDGMNQIVARVQESAKMIQELNTGAEKIGEVIGVIDGIADQTNLLALNAAIEAARAGEQGRGFAVVADEVRKLAESSAQSTQEIVSIIQTIQTETHNAVTSMERGVKEVEAGNQFASQAGEALEAIAQQILTVTDMIRQISTAAEEQTATTDGIVTNIQQIASITQQSANGAQNSAQSSVQLAELSNQLRDLVGQFKLSENGKMADDALASQQAELVVMPASTTSYTS